MKALMRSVWAIVGVLGLAAVVGLPRVEAAQISDDFRLSPMHIEPGFSGNYLKDAATVGQYQLRAEFSGESIPHYSGLELPAGVEARIYDVIGSFGPLPNTELGIDVPVMDLVPKENGLSSELAIGDLSVYAKYKLIHMEHLSVAAGFEAQVDTADPSNGVLCAPARPNAVCHFGFGERGYNPYGSFRYRMGRVAVGGHFGYELFDDPLGDVMNYDGDTLVAITDNLVFRVELSGLSQVRGTHRNLAAVMPGLDFRMGRMVVRAGGFKGITDASADWGLGGGVALTLGTPPKPPPPPPPPAPAVAEAPPPAPPPVMKKKIVLRSVHFDFDKAAIRADAKPILDEAASTLKDEGDVSVVVAGHTDSIGTDQYNLKLSKRRAEAVKQYLVGQGINASRLTVEGFGESQPVASNDTADGRAQNRRVELNVK